MHHTEMLPLCWEQTWSPQDLTVSVSMLQEKPTCRPGDVWSRLHLSIWVWVKASVCVHTSFSPDTSGGISRHSQASWETWSLQSVLGPPRGLFLLPMDQPWDTSLGRHSGGIRNSRSTWIYSSRRSELRSDWASHPLLGSVQFCPKVMTIDQDRSVDLQLLTQLFLPRNGPTHRPQNCTGPPTLQAASRSIWLGWPPPPKSLDPVMSHMWLKQLLLVFIWFIPQTTYTHRNMFLKIVLMTLWLLKLPSI